MKKTFILFLTIAMLLLCSCSSSNLTIMPCSWLKYDKDEYFVMETKDDLNDFIRNLENLLMENEYISDESKASSKAKMIKAIGEYNSDFFETKALVIYNVQGAPEIKYSVKKMSLANGELSIVIKEKSPKYVSAMIVKDYLLIPINYVEKIKTVKITFAK